MIKYPYKDKGGACMDILDLKRLKKESGMTNAEIAELSGIPVSTVNKIFSGATENPRYGTLLAIEQVLVQKEKLPFRYDEIKQEPCMVQEEATNYCYNARIYGKKDIESLDEWTRAELIDGKLYLLAAPNRMHQFLISELSFALKSHIRNKKGGCHVYPAPFAVKLFDDEKTEVQPDISVICNKDIMTDNGCSGAPDMVIEIVSASNSLHDYITKLMQYQKSGVREYWIVNPEQERVSVLNFENPEKTNEYTFDDVITSGVLEEFEIRINDFLDEY